MPPKAPNTTVVTPTIGPSTRNGRKTMADKPLLAFSKHKSDHIVGTGICTDVTNVETATKLLATHGMTIPSTGITFDILANSLFEFTIIANLGATNTDILRAFAIAIDDINQNEQISIITQKLTSALEIPIENLESRVEELGACLTQHKTNLECAVVEVRSQLHDSSEHIGKVVEDTIRATREQAETANVVTPRSEGPMNYANAVRSGISAPLTKILARSEAQTRQILIDKRSIQETSSLKDLTEAQLVAKATLAIELLKKSGKELPEGIAFLSARKLQHGGVLYEVDSPQTATWLNGPANRSGFLAHFGHDLIIKDRTYQTLLENVPITFDPNSPVCITEIEVKAGFKTNEITKARYIKPVARRNPGQRTAHAIFTFKTKNAANHAIRFGLTIEGRKVYGRKLIPEPTRCLKCHSIGGSHMAADCPQDHDTCGTCGASHRTSTCGVDNPELYFCVNCQSNDHATWNRDCPTFINKCESHRGRQQDYRYIYFPTDDPLTWDTYPEQHEEQQQTSYDQPNWNPPQPTGAPQGWKNAEKRTETLRQKKNLENPNRIPLNTQSRLPETWSNNHAPDPAASLYTDRLSYPPSTQ